jgi:cytochrome c-type biogenesis protein CcmH
MRATGISRRSFLVTSAGMTALLLRGGRLPAQDPSQLPGAGAQGNLGDPTAAGRPQAPTTTRDNDLAIQAIEKRLRCTCGCTLDIYTCRTTDFSCTYSPALHREVLALHDQGLDAQRIIDTFVAKYGEEALMAPAPKGFNLAGYLVPGALVTSAAALMVWILSRRRMIARAPIPAPALSATPEELERLRQALAADDS